MPHIDETTQRELLASIPPYLRDARSKGIPSIGAGTIYPVPWDEVICHPFPIPDFWRKGYGLDFGWTHPTAAVWLAQNPVDASLVVYSEYRKNREQPMIHAAAIKARGEWIKGAADPAGNIGAIRDGEKVISEYRKLGLHLVHANNAVDAGLDHIWTLLSTGRLKFFSTLSMCAKEYALYRRTQTKDANGVIRARIHKVDEDLMDALRYAVMTFDKIGAVKPANLRDAPQAPTIADRKAGY